MLSRLLTRREQALLLGFASAIVVGAATLIHLGEKEAKRPAALAPAAAAVAPPAAPPPLPEAPRVAPPPKQRIAVAIVGPVQRPGLYRMDEEARVGDLIDRAGGITREADLSPLDLTALLIDATTLTIPGKHRRERSENGALRLSGHSEPLYNPAPYLR